MQARATAKFIGTSTRKLGLVAGLVRGQQVSRARTLLNQTPKRAAGPLTLALASAVANAENNLNLRQADLVVEAVWIGPGPTLKRARPRARGSAGTILKRSSHITVIVSDDLAVSRTKLKNSKVKASVKPVVKSQLPATESKAPIAKTKAKQETETK